MGRNLNQRLAIILLVILSGSIGYWLGMSSCNPAMPRKPRLRTVNAECFKPAGLMPLPVSRANEEATCRR